MDEVESLLINEDLQGIKAWVAEVPEVLLEPDQFDVSLLENAISHSSCEIVLYLIEAGAPAAYPANMGYTSLHAAIERTKPGRDEIIKRLLEYGADINAHGINDWTPLHMAVAQGDINLVKLLVELGADTSIRTRIDDYATPVEEAKILGKTEVVNYLEQLPTTDS